MISDDYVLLTGCTGMLGEQLLVSLLQKGLKLALIVRSKNNLSPRKRVERLLDKQASVNPNAVADLTVFEGDVARPHCGLDKTSREWLRKHATTLVNNAASLTFRSSSSRGEPWLTNVEGTRHVLELTEWAEIDRLFHVSTAYVCGTRGGVVYESELDEGQGFRNDYERSKFLAEQLVRDRYHGNLTVIRPAIVVGDSRTGETSGYHGIYKLFQFTWVCAESAVRDGAGVWHHNVRLNLDGDERQNLIPVDWAANAMSEIVTNRKLSGFTYHLAPQHPTVSVEIEEALSRYFNYTGVRFVGKHVPLPDADSTLAEVAYYEAMRQFEDYWRNEPTFDMSALRAGLPQLAPPTVDVDALLRMIDFAVKDRWGKRQGRCSKTALRKDRAALG